MVHSSTLMKRVFVFALLLLVAAGSTAWAKQGQSKASKEDRPDRYSAEWIQRKVAKLHDKLLITPEQETAWTKVATAIQENSLTMKALIDKYTKDSAQLTALDSIRMHGDMAEQHAKGQRMLVTAFEALYNMMPAEQKAVADNVFARHEGRRKHKNR